MCASKSRRATHPLLIAAEGYIWTGQIHAARELAEFAVDNNDLTTNGSWEHRLLGIIHALEAEGAAEGAEAGLAKAEGAFRLAIQLAKESEAPVLEAMAAREFKRRVLDRHGRAEEGAALLADAAGRVEGTSEELMHFLSRSWLSPEAAVESGI